MNDAASKIKEELVESLYRVATANSVDVDRIVKAIDELIALRIYEAQRQQAIRFTNWGLI
jgi:hypothetical protein